MAFNVRDNQGVCVIDLKGKITIGSGDVELRETVKRMIKEGKKKMILNLEKVSYIDSAGLGEIIRCYTTISKEGGKIVLLNPSHKVYDLFQLTKLDQVFTVFDDENKAIVSFTD